MSIEKIIKKYHKKVSPLDLEILISHTIKKTREFVLANPQYKLSKKETENLKKYIERRVKNEPIAYITSHKEFYGIDFEVDKHTLIPRPETEQIVELTLKNIQKTNHKTPNTIIDIGTGSGNIIVSLAKNLESADYFAVDISKEALKIARKNARTHGVDNPSANKIKFLHGNLLDPIFKSETINSKSTLTITANLPYLSDEIYSNSPTDVKDYEPISALYSDNYGLAHYKKLLKQISLLATGDNLQIDAFFEISPEQKSKLQKLIKQVFLKAKIKFHKDLSDKWRICEIHIN